MSDHRDELAELQELLELVCEDRADAEDLARVQEIAQGSRAGMQFYVDYLDQHARLLWRFRRFATDATGDMIPACAIPTTDAFSVSDAIDGSFAPAQVVASHPAPGISPNSAHFASLHSSDWQKQPLLVRLFSAVARPFQKLPGQARLSRRFASPTIALGFGLVCFALGAASIHWLGTTGRSTEASDRGVVAKAARGAPQSTATLINVTNCLWDSSKGQRIFRDVSEVLPGQSLNLVEGIAEIVASRPMGGSGRYVLEGPLAMLVGGDSGTVLHYGKLFVAIASPGEPFTLGTPLGQIIVDNSASIGVVAANQSVALHVFSGEATFKLLWAESLLDEQRRFDVRAGSSIRLMTNADAALTIDRGVANERCFAVSVSMADSRLNLDSEYVDAIRKAAPLAYWRFEAIENGFVRNEMGNRWHGRVQGTIDSRDYLGNRSCELGIGQSSGYLMTDDNFGDLIKGSYTIEAWVKPSHIHSGTLLGLIDWSQERPLLTQHGSMLTLTGPAGPWAQVKPESLDPPLLPSNYKFNPERVRFLHRQPAGHTGGTDCYSEQAYELRKWQHYVCVKTPEEMRLYVDGKLAGRIEDESTLPPGLRVIIGQLYPSSIGGHSVFRQFVGEIDEVAFYDRALTEEEIQSHVDLAQDAKHDNHSRGNQSN